jgi:hypothetical protein
MHQKSKRTIGEWIRTAHLHMCLATYTLLTVEVYSVVTRLRQMTETITVVYCSDHTDIYTT